MQRTKNKTGKPLIGRVEKISFPELDIYGIDAKVDTGAYTSSLHCHDIELFEQKGEQWVKFYVLDPDHPEFEEKQYQSKVHDIRKIKSSNGLSEERVVIKQLSQFSSKKRVIELSLADRSAMRFPVLLGRKFLDQFIIDTSKKYLTE